MKKADYQRAVREALKRSTKLQKNIANAFLEKPDHRYLHKDLAARFRIRSNTLNMAFGKLGHRVYKILGWHPDGRQPPNFSWSSELVYFEPSDDGWIYVARKEFIDALASKVWLLFWNPTKNDVDDIPALIASGEEFRWRTGQNRHKVPRNGDRFFFVRVGSNPRGIVGYGTVTRDCEEDAYWNEESKLPTTFFFGNRFTSRIVDRTLTLEQLRRLNLTHQTWGHQGSILELENPREVEKIRTAFDQLGAESTTLDQELEAAGFKEGKQRLLREQPRT